MMMSRNQTYSVERNGSRCKPDAITQKSWNVTVPEKKTSVSFQDIIKEQEQQKIEELSKPQASKQSTNGGSNGYRRHHQSAQRRSLSNVRRYPVHRLGSASQKKKGKKEKARLKAAARRHTDQYQDNYEYTQQMMHEDYLYSCSQMYSYFNPIHSANFITDDDLTIEERARYVSLDCEMVGIGLGGYKSAVARVCIVNWDGIILLDTFVKVPEPVTDFRTFVSGIREENLQSDSAMEFVHCRAIVEAVLRGKILIGHALKNDLQALTISHPWYDIRDTAKYEPFCQNRRKCSSESDCSSTSSISSNSSASSISSILQLSQLQLKPRRLKDLAEEMLGIQIQVDGSEHSPVEDALAALSLYKLQRKKWEKVMEYKIHKTSAMCEKNIDV